MWFNRISIITLEFTWLRIAKQNKKEKHKWSFFPSQFPSLIFIFCDSWPHCATVDPKVSLFGELGNWALSTCIRSFQLNAWNASTPATDSQTDPAIPVPNSLFPFLEVLQTMPGRNKSGKVIRINWPWTLFPADLLADILVRIQAVPYTIYSRYTSFVYCATPCLKATKQTIA